MQDKNRFSLRKASSSPSPARFPAPLLCWVLALWLVGACAPQAAPPPPPTYPSRVITQEGMAYMVNRLRLPGTRQEILIQDGSVKQWLPLNLIQSLRFSGAPRERYRQAEIILTSGERLQGEVFVGTLVEGTTDLGYWNMPLARIERLDLGAD